MNREHLQQRRLFLKRFMQYSLLGISGFSVPLIEEFVEKAQAETKPSGINTNVVRMGYQTSGDIIRIKGVLEPRLKELGVSVEWAPFPAGPQLLEAMNADRVDIGSVGETPPIFAQAAGAQLVYIAGRKPSKGEGSGLIVRQDSPFRRVADLKGQKVIFQKGSASHYLLLRALQEAGLKFSDVQAVSLTPAEARDAFLQKKIDAWVTWDPFYAFVQKNAGARTLRNAARIATQGGFYLSRREFATQNPGVVKVILEEIDKLGQWAEANPTEIVKILAPELKLEPSLLEVVVRRRTYSLRKLTPSIVKEQQRIADAFYQEKVIPRKIDLKQALLTPQQYAAITPARLVSQR
ncbi:ABC transporter substrate-binding protein [Scytonema hofmannii PCC 7110]|uniref:Putative aliphatic sulfonates-binding protein n=1 Tax=Scytonema hofmannii PCC 7110 TaxID=128403 RepID=A0A139X4A9_9CYAN|nr:sulfonate ABC transporter substrate-binding protein [Scytonema hofmannii]KYC39537.1 ABC transporter substrate-binding protein [Scytonema hofmannii PCC 7110]